MRDCLLRRRARKTHFQWGMVRTRYSDDEYASPTSQRSNWVFTICNPTDSDIAAMHQEQNYRALVCQHEICPNTGTPHIQGYVEFSRSMRARAVCRILGNRARIYIRLGSQEDALRYVRKEESRDTAFPMVHLGTLKKEDGESCSAFENLREALESEDAIGKVARDHFALMMRYRCSAIWYRNLRPQRRNWQPRVEVYYGDTGTGKTRRCEELFPKAFWLFPPNVRNGPVWFTRYSGESDVVIDDFYGWMPWTLLLRVLDRYPLQVHVHGSSVPFLARSIVLTSNVHPDQWYDYDRSPHMKYAALARRIDKITKFSDGIGGVGTDLGSGRTLCSP